MLTGHDRGSAEDKTLVRLHGHIAPVLVAYYWCVLPRLDEQVVQRANAAGRLGCATGTPINQSSTGGERRGRDALDLAEEDVDDGEEDHGVRVVAYEGRAEAAEDDVHRNADGEEEARCDDVHPRQGIHGGSASD